MSFEWNKIYDVDEGGYHEQLEKNREYYSNIGKEEYRTLDDCVKFALAEGNHAAFAHFFLMEERSRKRVFGRTVSELLNRLKKVEGYTKKACWSQAPIIQQSYWRSFDFEYTWEHIWELVHGKAKKTIAYTFNAQKGNEPPTRANWRKGVSIPPRDVIIQIAICLGISIEDTNRLLRSAGMNTLYVLDLIDVCSMFTLRQYEGDYSVSPFGKLQMTKNQINRALGSLNNDKMVLFKDDYAGVNMLGAPSPIGWDVDREIGSLKDVLSGDLADPALRDESLTLFLTKLYEAEFHKSGSMDSFIRPHADGKSEFQVFLQKYYGFLHRTKLFLEKEENYEKNTKFTGWTLTAQGEAPRNFSDFPFNVGIQSSQNRADHEALLQKIAKIWYITDLVGRNENELANGDEWAAGPVTAGALSVPRQMIEGRKTEDAYEMNFGNKVHLMKYAVATGNEDEVGKYLKLAGVWEKDWYHACASGETEGLDSLDRSDCLMLYALLYRDKLIESWNVNGDRIYASRLRAAFPMIKLLLTINRDVTLALMKLYDEKGKERDYDGIESAGVYFEEDLASLQDEMIYPIAWYFKYLDKKEKNLQLNDKDDNYKYGRAEEVVKPWRKQVLKKSRKKR